ncbi:ImmA/IrrE family metallo-endopeptidase [Bacillota bacterium Meth-B3]
MDDVERLDQKLTDEGVLVDYNVLHGKRLRGLYAAGDFPPTILVNGGMTLRARRCILAEEAGHHYRSCGHALDERDTNQRKNELAGRDWAYAELVPLSRLVESWQCGNTTIYDLADDLDVTEDFLRSAIEYHHRKHGVLATWEDWIIQFDPHFDIYRE